MITNRLLLHFPSTVVDQPIIYRLVKDFDLVVNIIKADISPKKEGSMIMEVRGSREYYRQGMELLQELGVQVRPLSRTVVRNDQRCTQCGYCVSVCPSGALFLEPPGMEPRFDLQKCVVCGSCVQYCPFRAMEVDLGYSQ